MKGLKAPRGKNIKMHGSSETSELKQITKKNN